MKPRLKLTLAFLAATFGALPWSASAGDSRLSDTGILRFNFQVDDHGAPAYKTGTAALIARDAPLDPNAEARKFVLQRLTGVDTDRNERNGPHQELFIVTNAHIAQGSNWQLQKPGDSQPSESFQNAIQGSITDPLCDLSVIKIDPSKLSQVKNLLPFGALGRDPDSRDGPQDRIYAYNDAIIPWRDGRDTGDVHRETGENYISVEPSASGRDYSGAYVLTPSWSRKDLLESASLDHIAGLSWDRSNFGDDINTVVLGRQYNTRILESQTLQPIQYQAFTGRIWAPARIAPGTSGAPMVKPVLKSGKVYSEIRGFGTSYVKGMTGSTFCSDQTLLELLSKYRDGETQFTGPGRWKYRDGQFVLDYSPTSSETYPAQQRAGNDRVGSPGNDRVGSPGNDRVGSPGNDRAGSPGNDRFGSPGNDRIGSPAQSAQETTDARKLGILPGTINWNGTPTVAFKLLPKGTLNAAASASGKKPKNGKAPAASSRPPVDDSRAIYLSPNESSVALIQQYGDQFDVEPVPFGSDLSKAMENRIGTRGRTFRSVSDSVNSVTNQRSQIERTQDGKIHFTLFGEKGEMIQFVLNPDLSRVGCASGAFEPLFEINGNRGNPYIVDLHEFFAADTANILLSERRPQDVSTAKSILHAAPSKMDELLRAESNRGAYISFRKKGDGGVTQKIRFRGDDPLAFPMPEAAPAAGSCQAASSTAPLRGQDSFFQNVSRISTFSQQSGGHDR